jgi:peptide-methionine (S)-S-oxide reductase
VFWENHDPTRNSWSRQYMAAVFYHDEEQKKLIEESLRVLERRTGKEVRTKVLPYIGFYLAEDYHQKHALQRYPNIMEELRDIYPSFDGFLSSAAVTRINGYLGGYGSCDELKDEAQALGLSAEAVDTLSTVVCGRKGVVSCPVPGK